MAQIKAASWSLLQTSVEEHLCFYNIRQPVDCTASILGGVSLRERVIWHDQQFEQNVGALHLWLHVSKNLDAFYSVSHNVWVTSRGGGGKCFPVKGPDSATRQDRLPRSIIIKKLFPS